MLQITRTKLQPASEESISVMRRQFYESQSLYLPRFVDTSLLAPITAGLGTATFDETRHLDSKNEEFARDHTINGSHVVTHIFHLILNNPALFLTIQSITGCQSIGSFSGRIYRSTSAPNDHLSWHDDHSNPDRLIGLSVNFSKVPYQGGVFQLRKKHSGVILNEIANTEPGSALIFRISSHLEHRITPVEGDNPKVAGAGWFSSNTTGLSIVKNMAKGNSQ
jgi:hypothetical protein